MKLRPAPGFVVVKLIGRLSGGIQRAEVVATNPSDDACEAGDIVYIWDFYKVAIDPYHLISIDKILAWEEES